MRPIPRAERRDARVGEDQAERYDDDRLVHTLSWRDGDCQLRLGSSPAHLNPLSEEGNATPIPPANGSREAKNGVGYRGGQCLPPESSASIERIASGYSELVGASAAPVTKFWQASANIALRTPVGVSLLTWSRRSVPRL